MTSVQSLRANQFRGSLEKFIENFQLSTTAQAVLDTESLNNSLMAEDAEADTPFGRLLRQTRFGIFKAHITGRSFALVPRSQQKPSDEDNVRKCMLDNIHKAYMQFIGMTDELQVAMDNMKEYEDTHSLLKCSAEYRYQAPPAVHSSRPRSPTRDNTSQRQRDSGRTSPQRRSKYEYEDSARKSRSRSRSRPARREPSRDRRDDREEYRDRRSGSDEGLKSRSRTGQRDQQRKVVEDTQMAQLRTAISADRRVNGDVYKVDGCTNCQFVGRAKQAIGHSIQDCRCLNEGFKKLSATMGEAARSHTPKSARK